MVTIKMLTQICHPHQLNEFREKNLGIFGGMFSFFLILTKNSSLNKSVGLGFETVCPY